MKLARRLTKQVERSVFVQEVFALLAAVPPIVVFLGTAPDCHNCSFGDIAENDRRRLTTSTDWCGRNDMCSRSNWVELYKPGSLDRMIAASMDIARAARSMQR